MCGVLAAAPLAVPVLAADDQPPGDASKPLIVCSVGSRPEPEAGRIDKPEYTEALRRLQADFEVRVSREALTEQSLRGVRVLWIPTPSDKPERTQPAQSLAAPDIVVLTRFVETGGGLLLFTRPAAGEESGKAPLHQLLRRFGVVANPVLIGPKKLQIPKTCPLIGGLGWAASDLHTFDIQEAGPLVPPVLVMNDLQQPPANAGAKDSPGAVMIWGEFGKGRVAIVADTRWVSDESLNKAAGSGGLLRNHDNWELMRRLSRWVAKLPSPATATSDK